MICSLNEIQSAVLKATRGAGLSWGLAEEASRAARWLAARDLPGVASLATLLERIYAAGDSDVAPLTDGNHWRAAGDWVSGLHAGIAFADLAGEIEDGGELVINDVAEPLLLLPFAALASRVCASPLAVSWPGCEKMLSAGDIVGAVPIGQLADHAPLLTIRVVEAPALAPAPKPEARSVYVDDGVWTRLEAFAKRTYVPESEESRAQGAGSGTLIDTD